MSLPRPILICSRTSVAISTSRSTFYSYDGSVALDPKTLNTGDIVSANGDERQPQVGGLAYIEAGEYQGYSMLDFTPDGLSEFSS